ncbi:MAG: hypothetical protein R3195_15925 [Gemmatimonadota bacterium]|nr:hypothetical protein [Gemmatimonadota bacterium]
MNISLAGLTATAVETDPNGVIGPETVFHFRQEDDRVWVHYEGGRIDRGYLVGLIDRDQLRFRYCQIESDGTLNGGVSVCELDVDSTGRRLIIERFEWESRDGGGRNVIRERDVDPIG